MEPEYLRKLPSRVSVAIPVPDRLIHPIPATPRSAVLLCQPAGFMEGRMSQQERRATARKDAR